MNRPWIEKWGSIPILDLGDVIIAGSGPTLDKDMAFIKKHQKEMTIISADMALKPLLKNNIKPHIVVSAEINLLQLFTGLDTSEINLMAHVCIAPHHLRAFKGRVAFYGMMGDLPEIQAPGVSLLCCGGNVGTIALFFAVGCNAKRIFITGLDFGFRYQYYCRDTKKNDDFIYNRFTPTETSEMNIIRTKKDMGGYRTNTPFLMAEKWTAEFLKDKKNVYMLSKREGDNNGYNSNRGEGLPCQA